MFDKINKNREPNKNQYRKKLDRRTKKKMEEDVVREGVYFLMGTEYGLYYDEATELYVFYRGVPRSRSFDTVGVGVSIEYFTGIEVTVETYDENLAESNIEDFGEKDAVEWFKKATRGIDSLGEDYSIFDYITLDVIEPEVAIPYTAGEIQVSLVNPPVGAVYTLNAEPLADEEAKEVYQKIEGDSNE
jgi:hypothetical protein